MTDVRKPMRPILVIGLAVSLLVGGVAAAQTVEAEFERNPVDQPDPNGNSVIGNCGGEYLDATATLRIDQDGCTSRVEIDVENARPFTLFTVWLRLRGNDSSGVSFGGSPLTNGGSTPLAPSSALGSLLDATGPGNGSDQVANGFLTDGEGRGTMQVELDFPILGGAYPFHRFAEFDASDARYPIANPRIFPVAIVGPEVPPAAPFTLRMVSHCLDDVGHGLTPGGREPWFDWPASDTGPGSVCGQDSDDDSSDDSSSDDSSDESASSSSDSSDSDDEDRRSKRRPRRRHGW